MPPQSWATLIVGSLAMIGVIVTWQQKNRADRRSEWWRRTSWAFEQTFSGGDRKAELGWAILDVMTRSKLVTVDDNDIVQVISEHAAVDDVDEEDGDAHRRDT
ncbi:hypothetical protein KIH27_09985 [Mycobacterium sp. M1]|uniref:Bacteriophage protein n=1 Tax=Mycolicibacter acidiphilus TaxID=2835306 RepID=A0ABS5RHZ0_9MYCO|nr:hypothetical protein [Mycolicibacter acidiphilus]MBS9533913.1 hypothetical protein [Mycolicibacter acidiphilus]